MVRETSGERKDFLGIRICEKRKLGFESKNQPKTGSVVGVHQADFRVGACLLRLLC
jgi:hypothetical protein